MFLSTFQSMYIVILAYKHRERQKKDNYIPLCAKDASNIFR